MGTFLFYLSKILRPFLTSPLFLCLAMAVIAIVALPATTRRRRAVKTLGLLACALLILPRVMGGEPVVVRYPEGLVHGFLSLRTLEGDKIADGELIQFSKGVRVTSRLVFRFTDGSVHDETVIFSQRGRFRMLRDHLIQKGPAFPHPLEAEIDGTRGDVKIRSWDEEGKERVFAQHLDLPPDVCNGLILTLNGEKFQAKNGLLDLLNLYLNGNGGAQYTQPRGGRDASATSLSTFDTIRKDSSSTQTFNGGGDAAEINSDSKGQSNTSQKAPTIGANRQRAGSTGGSNTPAGSGDDSQTSASLGLSGELGWSSTNTPADSSPDDPLIESDLAASMICCF